ncbi:ATPase F0F1 [Candidatus Tenderia electrophaga]|jgi:ATP synthase protein I|uniref:ATPase F0F1 n=1 Tax=Candidatus Tenderia electrophaga TaxID=1748243 RepID=A0A0S2TFC0_9GAMM|nr:ATPase F0F1 [Candidatus Tenderia electrophaga]
MADDPNQDNPQQHFRKEAGKRVRRKLRTQDDRDKSGWFWFGMFGMVGWAVAIPTVIGIAIGLWLDRVYAGPPSWTLNLLIVGVILGCLNAWYWVKQESRRD